MNSISSLPVELICAGLYGVTMKVADLLDEHGLHWFKGDALAFGLLWGIFGSLLVVSDKDVANIVLAMVLAFLVRLRLDYRNHAIAATIIIITFLITRTLNISVFFPFLVVFLLFGGIKDFLNDIRKKKDWLYKINEIAWYYVIPPAIYGIITHQWTVFLVFTTYVIFYDLVKVWAKDL